MEKIYFIESKEQYLEAVKAWKKYINENRYIAPTSSQLLLYNIIKSQPWNKGFSPVTKKSKLDNGCDKWYGLNRAIEDFNRSCNYYSSGKLLEPFGKTISIEDTKRAWEIIVKEKAKLK